MKLDGRNDKLDEYRKRNCTDATPILHCTVYPTFTLQNQTTVRFAKIKDNPEDLGLPLATNTAAGEQYKAKEARSASLGTGFSPFICCRAKTCKESKQCPSRPPLKCKA